MDSLDDLLHQWNIRTPTAVTRPSRGTNNTVWLIDADDSYVLRIHHNAGPDQILREHALLAELNRRNLPFAVPAPLPAGNGSTLVPTPEGPASLYRRLPGTNPPLTEDSLALAGKALGELDAVLAELPHALAPIDWRRSLNDIHPAVPSIRQLADDLCRELPTSPAATWFAEHVTDVDDQVQALRTTLPIQLVHGDFDLANLLVENNTVTAILDFEIAGLDLRANDLAAALPLTSENPNHTKVFRTAYATTITLTPAEDAALPLLSLHHALGSVIWRAGRHRQGLSTFSEVADRLAAAHQHERQPGS